MRNDEFERRAAEMRARQGTTKTTLTRNHVVARGTAKASSTPSHSPPVLVVPEIPIIPPYSLLRGPWRPSHTKALLSALGDVNELVIRSARSIGAQQVGHDGLVYLSRGVLDIGASTGMLPEALRVFNVLLEVASKRGFDIRVKTETTLTIQGESVQIRIRETSERRPKPANAQDYRSYEYVPTGRLWFSVVQEHGGNLKTSADDADGFLDKVTRFVARLPKLRAQRMERERLREEEWARRRAAWQQEEDQRQQWARQQDCFNQITKDVAFWKKAERVRAYAKAFEEHHLVTVGAIKTGSAVDGWLRWVYWYAEHLDPITRPEGPTEGPLARSRNLQAT